MGPPVLYVHEGHICGSSADSSMMTDMTHINSDLWESMVDCLKELLVHSKHPVPYSP